VAANATTHAPADALPHVVIVGGGFGGLYAARALKRAPVRVTLIDRRNFHLFQPLLYQVATGGLSPGEIASPLRSVLKWHTRTRVILAEVVDIEPQNKRVILGDGVVPYDTLVVAAGARHSYFGHPEWESRAPGLKTLEDAIELRRRIFFAFESAEREEDPLRRAAWLTFVIVGAGPTGVELAGALGEIARDTLKHDFRSINPRDAQIILVEGTDRVLPPYHPVLSAKAMARLTHLGVTVRLKTMVINMDDESVLLRTGAGETRIRSNTVVWAAGVQASPLGQVLATHTGVALDRAGRVMVAPDLTVPSYPDIFVVGDLAHYAHQTQGPLPGVAPVAMQQGRYVSGTIEARLRGRAVEPFRYRDRGSMAVIGRAAAVADLGWVRFNGTLAWLTWLFIHLLYLVEFDNRLLVLVQWAWNYLTWNRGARLITAEERPLPGPTRREPATPP
jgi:NADH:ubiquinone reductase (H+-translocating)